MIDIMLVNLFVVVAAFSHFVFALVSAPSADWAETHSLSYYLIDGNIFLTYRNIVNLLYCRSTCNLKIKKTRSASCKSCIYYFSLDPENNYIKFKVFWMKVESASIFYCHIFHTLNWLHKHSNETNRN